MDVEIASERRLDRLTCSEQGGCSAEGVGVGLFGVQAKNADAKIATVTQSGGLANPRQHPLQSNITQDGEGRPESSEQLLALLRGSTLRVLVPSNGRQVVLELHVARRLPDVRGRSLWQLRCLVPSDCRRIRSPEHLNEPWLRISGY